MDLSLLENLVLSPLLQKFPAIYVGNSSWGSSVGVVSHYRLDEQGSIPSRAKGHSLQPVSRPALEAHPASYPMGTGDPFPGGKAWLGRDAAEVNE
jgi:hypothetical protein